MLNKKSMVYRVAHPLLGSAWAKVKIKYLQTKYSDHAYPKSFDWDWLKTHYNRIALVNLLVAQKPDCVYLEIGCASNALFDSVPVKNKTGVDPASGGTVRKTSDDFFATNKITFDVVFIDGLHTYDQIRRDVIHSIKFLKPGGWIAFHDMLPRNWIEHHVPVVTPAAWSGDVWKLAFELAQTDGIDFKILKIDHGVGVLKLTKNNPVLLDKRRELENEQFSYLFENIQKLPLMEWKDAIDWLKP